MFKVERISHVAITVPNVEETAAFYEQIVGLEISDRTGGAVFLRCMPEHHCLAIYPGAARSLHHLRLEVADEAALESARSELEAQDLRAEPRTFEEPGHGPAHCYRDPDGNLIELFVGMQNLSQPLPARGSLAISHSWWPTSTARAVSSPIRSVFTYPTRSRTTSPGCAATGTTTRSRC